MLKLEKTDIALSCLTVAGIIGMISIVSTPIVNAVTQDSTVTVTLGAIIELDISPADGEADPPTSMIINTSPTENGGFGSGTETVTVSSNNPAGYIATLKMRQNDKDLNYLVSPDTTIYTNGGTVLDTTKNVVAPTSTTSLSENTWGVSLGSANSYVAVPVNTTSTPINLLAGASTSNKGTAAGTDTVTVTFGVRAGFSLPAGTSYSNTVLYTATNNPI